MPTDEGLTPQDVKKFDFSAYPPDTLFHERRTGLDRRDRPPTLPLEPAPAPKERRARKERRRRIDPTTFEKQYTDDEIEFMNSMQQFKTRTGKSFPSYGDVLRVAASLGYRKVYWDDDEDDSPADEPSQVIIPTIPV